MKTYVFKAAIRGRNMEKRKNICFITAVPESFHAHRVTSGVLRQCEKYGYNVAVFSSMITPDFFYKDYAEGELNIYNLPNYSMFDGVIIDIISMVLQEKTGLADRIYHDIKEKAYIPVIGIGMPIKDLPMIESDNDLMIRELCRHIVNVHKCKKICLLTGQKGNSEAEMRLNSMLDELSKLGVSVKDEHIVYGNFWYTSGKELAEKFISGKIEMPEAVIAASDHMALGLMEELRSNGIRIPEDIRVVGFEATQEALLNDIPLTSIKSNFEKSASDAVDRLRAIIEPGKEIIPFEPDLKDMLILGRSCGCTPDIDKTIGALKAAMYYPSKNYATDLYIENIDIGLLMESYIPEKLTASRNPEECIKKIYETTYILAPFVNYYMCLREDWLDIDAKKEQGYPDRIKLVIKTSKDHLNDRFSDSEALVFNTEELLPGLFSDQNEQYVYYFAPMHFEDRTFGYSVLQRKISEREKISVVFRNWLRFANNALEMARSKNMFVTMSYHDKMTGLLNRRGMYDKFEDLSKYRSSDEKVFAFVIDMDGLKIINDTYGHQEGDIGIITVSKAVSRIADINDICVRAGGDEFTVIGIGDLDTEGLEKKKASFYQELEKLTKNLDKPYQITASIGYAARPFSQNFQLDSLILEADEAMYSDKMARKRNNK